MSMNRREFAQMIGLAGAAGMFPGSVFAARKAPSELYEVPAFGDVRVLHMADCHAQLLPIYFREPNVNIGVGDRVGKAPHLVGKGLLKQFDIAPGSLEAHAFTFLDFNEAAAKYGKVGGFAHLSTLIKSLRADYGDHKTPAARQRRHLAGICHRCLDRR